jgi:DNA-binding FrmR family transcriptional regulator
MIDIGLLRDPLRFLVEKIDDHRRINQLIAAVNGLAEMLEEQKDRVDVTQEIAIDARVKALDALSIAQEWAEEKRGKA